MKQQNEKKQREIWFLLLLSIIVYFFIDLIFYSKDTLIDTFWIIFTTSIFLIASGIMALLLWVSCVSNKLHLALRYYFAISIPSLVLAMLIQQLLFYAMTKNMAGLFFSFPSIFIPILIAGITYWVSLRNQQLILYIHSLS